MERQTGVKEWQCKLTGNCSFWPLLWQLHFVYCTLTLYSGEKLFDGSCTSILLTRKLFAIALQLNLHKYESYLCALKVKKPIFL